VLGVSCKLVGIPGINNSLTICIAWSQIIVGGSNFGELLGAFTVLLLTEKVITPLPWLRLDALMLNLVWVLPFIKVTSGNVKDAWRLAGIFIPISFGWAAGDVSLAAYIQSTVCVGYHLSSLSSHLDY
jgi:hypothetical protein